MTQRHRARRSGIAATIGLIVEGQAEYAALPLLHSRRLLPGCPPLKAVNLHGVGSDRSPVGIAKLVAPKVIEHKAAGREKVVLCFDRESRDECASDFATSVLASLTAELRSRGKPSNDVHVVVANRAFEAWLLADAQGLYERRVFKKPPGQRSYEGALGAQQQKGVVELTQLLARPYRKTTDGPGLFVQLDLRAARAHRNSGRGSKSFDKFLRTLGC